MTTILIKKKDTAGAPAPGDLTNSAGGTEIAVNTATKRIYTKDAAGNVVELGTNGSATTLASLTVTGATALNGTVALGDAAADSITVNGTITSNLIFTDNTYDIGASGATRPRDMFLGRNLTVGGTLTLAGGVNLNGNVTIGDSSADTLTVNSTITSNLIFTDNTYDIGASGATRPRSMFLGTNLTVGGLSNLSGNVAINGAATAWTGASALTITDYVAIGQQNTGNANGIFSWNAKWSGGTSGGGYTYLKAGDVASAVEQNGEFRFYTTASTGSVGGAISFSQRALIGNSGLTVNGAVEMATSGIFPTVGFTYNSNGYLYTKGGSAGVITQIANVNRFGIDSSGRVGFGSTVATADRFMDAAFAGATVSGANQFGMVLNPTYPNTVTSSLFNLYTGANVTAGATFTSAFGVYIEGGNYAGSTVTNKYGLYQAGSSDRNYFAGNVGIGLTNTTLAKLAVLDSTDVLKQIVFSDNATYYGAIGHGAGSGYNHYRTETGGSHGFYRGMTSTTPDVIIGTTGNMLQMTGRSSTAYGITNVQEWTGQVLNIANGASFSLFAINAQYDMLCYDLNIFCSTGGFFSYKSAGVFGYNGFTNTVLGSTCAITITKTGTLYNETMTLTNNQGSTFTELVISLRVWGFAVKNNVSTGGQDIVTSSYLVRQN